MSEEENKNVQFTKEQLHAADYASVLDYAKARGIGLKRTGNNSYNGVEHDSLMIDPAKNGWFWNSRGLHGRGALSFAKEYELYGSNLSKAEIFRTAVTRVLKANVGAVKYEAPKREPFKYNKAMFSKDVDKAADYLINVRKISPETVSKMIKNGAIKQDLDGNCVFLWTDLNQKVRGMTIQGTTIDYQKYGKRGTLKKIAKNSEHGYGFCFIDTTTDDKPINLRFFESPIDAISYYDLSKRMGKPLINTAYISMDGLKDEVFNSYVLTFYKTGIKIGSIALGVDNDEAGQNFYKKIHGRFSKVEYAKVNKKFGKDWNDMLKCYVKLQEQKSKDKSAK